MAYTIRWANHGLIWTYSGVLTGEELIKSNLEIYGDARFSQLYYQIVDLRMVREFKVLPEHMRRIAELDAAAYAVNRRIRVAVVTSEVTGAHMNRSYDQNSPEEHWETQVFRDYGKADEWTHELI
ncbi:MAG: hypothetical protein ACPGJU_03380 [Coraliomargarita sp.]